MIPFLVDLAAEIERRTDVAWFWSQVAQAALAAMLDEANEAHQYRE